jgi:hypothetical protein
VVADHIADGEFRRGFPVGTELGGVHLVRLRDVSEVRRAVRTRNNVRNDLRGRSDRATDDLIARLAQRNETGADAAVKTFVLVNAAAELIVRERREQTHLRNLGRSGRRSSQREAKAGDNRFDASRHGLVPTSIYT